MTSEERMAYYQNKKGNVKSLNHKPKETVSYGKIRFLIAFILFMLFLSLDYTEYKFYGIGSREIITELQKDDPIFYKVASKF